MASIHLVKHWDKIFWLTFIAMLVFLAASAMQSTIKFEHIVLWVFLILIGSGKLSQEVFGRKTLNYQDDLYRKLHTVSKQLEQTFNMANAHKERTDFRFYTLNKKRRDIETKIDKNYRDIAKKLIEIENRVNRLSKTFMERELQRLNAQAGESFSEKVLNLIRNVPHGKVTTYSEIAKILGNPKASKAVGKILSRSTHLKSIPFHRVVRSDGLVVKTGNISVKKRVRMLKKEGVSVKKNKVNLKKHLYKFIPEI